MRRMLAIVVVTLILVTLGAPVQLARAAGDGQCDRSNLEAGKQWVDRMPDAFAALGIESAWKLSRGRGVTVAIIDSGVQGTHPALKDVLLKGKDFLGDPGDGRIDKGGHGTILAGQIAAQALNQPGMVGMAPEVKILPVRVFESNSRESAKAGKGPDLARLVEGIEWAAAQKAQILVVAQSSPADVPQLRKAVKKATAAGSLVVASSGNLQADADNELVRFPAGYPETLAVTAIDTMSGAPSQHVVHGAHVEIAAPGSMILSATLDGRDCMFAADAATTSWATGYVGAIAALVASAHPDETPADWEYRLLVTASRTSANERTPTLGWGIVSPYAAINFLNDGSAVGPPNPRYPNPAAPADGFGVEPPRRSEVLDQRREWGLASAAVVAACLAAIMLVARLRRRRA